MNESNRGIYVLPNLITAGNLICGFLAVLQIFEGTMQRQFQGADWHKHYEYSLGYILLACVFDLFDGRVARMSGQESPFGRELDSLADIVSFGVAPALLTFEIVLVEIPDNLGWVIATLYLLCGAYRLARYNITSPGSSKKSSTSHDFEGLPIPVAAGVIASITLFLVSFYANDPGKSIGNWKYGLVILMIFLSIMMFSTIRYPSFKGLHWKTRRSVPKVLLFAATLLLIAFYYRYSLAVVFTLYLIYGFIRPMLPKRYRADFEEEDPHPSSQS